MFLAQLHDDLQIILQLNVANPIVAVLALGDISQVHQDRIDRNARTVTGLGGRDQEKKEKLAWYPPALCQQLTDPQS